VHDISCPVWRPLGSLEEERAAFFLGAMPTLVAPEAALAAAAARGELTTAGTGRVHARLEVVFRGVEAAGIEW
jgi:hypothetical protein